MAHAALNAPPADAGIAGQLLVGGSWVQGVNTAPVLDKYQLRPFAEVHLPSREQVHACIAAAEAAFRASTLDSAARGAILDRAADLMEGRSDELVEILRREAGFPRADAASEIRRCAMTFRLSAEEARRFAGELVPLEGAGGQRGRIGFTLRVPLGVVCAITPFNAPLNTVAHKVGPALAAGNAVVLKPSQHTPVSSCVVAEVLIEAGLPAGLISVLHGGPDVVYWLLDEPAVRFYAFTGSTEAGRAIQERAGLRRTQMELGSIAHCVICADADLDRALPKVVNAGFRKAGQVCTSIQVLLVERPLVPEVEARLTSLVGALPYGDPGENGTVVGPVISEASAERIESWIARAVEAGARRLTGGVRQGAVVPPTLLADVDPSTPLGCQEVFGPVMCIAPFDTIDEAIRRVNATPYGLATGIFTNRLDTALQAARRLEVGGVHINETPSSRVDAMPYGGTKDSGFGREGPRYAVREMSEERMVTLLA
ncbi:aldehyde dehydrogenase family protein [Enterovirga aerilata]|uniref:Aldehyde dehydrogenase family protein n=1 Tax=Enterovirga aerilata TaxID=2730920 RepID=A0A849I732_9HYPH|nr:aldehyde dehydrogenase family protein [Enterovirga sp. DB1703]NNM75292.1 aldehyde dehydrogenase family protein [Enterovirga sp. DB1703]